MQIVITLAEAENIILKHLRDNGHNVKGPVQVIRRTEGEYEESIEVVDGFTVDLEGTS